MITHRVDERSVMKRTLIWLLLLAAPVSAQKIRIPPVTRDTLENGLTVLLMQYTKVPVVNFRLVVHGGSAQDGEGREGVASVTTALMREGTSTRSASDIAKAIDFMGGYLSVDAGLDYCAANAEVLKKDVDSCLSLFADVVMRPSFPEEELERERKQRLAGLEAIKEEPASVVSLVFSRSVYGRHPYGLQRNGTHASINGMTRDLLLEFYRRTFMPNNAVLVVVGDVQRDTMLGKLRAVFSSWPRGERQDQKPDMPGPVVGKQVILVDKPDATQTQIRLGHTGIDIRSPDYFPVMVANTVFGGAYTSRLLEELRVKRSLTYDATSVFPAGLCGGSFGIGTFTKNGTATEAIDVILEQAGKFREKGATAEELQKAKNYIAGNFARSLQTPAALASRLTDIELYGFPAGYLAGYVEKVRGVTSDDVRRVADKYFRLDDRILVLFAPASVVRQKAEQYGTVQVISLDEAVK